MAANLSAARVPDHYDAAACGAISRSWPPRCSGHPLVYLDSAASAQRPLAVLRAVEDYETHSHANVHRGVHALSQAATAAFEGARERVRRFINAASMREIIFVRGTTEAINLVAQAWARPTLKPGDEILITRARAPRQHRPVADGVRADRVHAARRADQPPRRARARRVPRAADSAHPPGGRGARLQRARHGAAAEAHHRRSARPWRAGAGRRRAGRAAPERRRAARSARTSTPSPATSSMDRPASACCTGASELLAAMPPWQGGGDMIRTVTFEKTTYNDLPWKFEAGTPNISGAVGLAAAIDYVESLGLDAIARARAAAAAAGDRGARAPAGHPDHRHGGRQGRRDLLHHEGRAPARSRHDPRCAKASRCAPGITAPCR